MSRLQVAARFVDNHNENHTVDVEPKECPVCDLLYQETKDAFRIEHSDLFRTIVDDYMRRWSGLGYCIANKEVVPDGLGVCLLDLFAEWLPLALPPCNFEPRDLVNHPYVIKKCGK
jgi:hypothetical protein